MAYTRQQAEIEIYRLRLRETEEQEQTYALRFANTEATRTNFISEALLPPIRHRVSNPYSSITPTMPPEAPRPPDPPDFPKFDGTGVRDWINRCEQFFYLHNIPPEQKTRLASLHTEGQALHWNRDFICNHYGFFPSWPEYFIAASARFREPYDEPSSEPMRLKQSCYSVGTYQDKFECTNGSRLEKNTTVSTEANTIHPTEVIHVIKTVPELDSIEEHEFLGITDLPLEDACVSSPDRVIETVAEEWTRETEFNGAKDKIAPYAVRDKESNPEKESRPEVSQQIERFPHRHVQYPMSSNLQVCVVHRKKLKAEVEICFCNSESILDAELRDGIQGKHFTGLPIADRTFMNGKLLPDFSIFTRVWEPGGLLCVKVQRDRSQHHRNKEDGIHKGAMNWEIYGLEVDVLSCLLEFGVGDAETKKGGEDSKRTIKEHVGKEITENERERQDFQIYQGISCFVFCKGPVCDEEKKKLRNVAADAKKGKNGFEGYVKVNSIDEEEFVGFIESSELQLAREILVTNSGIFTNTRLIQAEFYMKHKWRSKSLQTISVFRTTHSSKFADLVLKWTLTGRTRTDSSQAIIDDVWKLFSCPRDHKTNFVAESDIYKSGQHSSRKQKRWIKKFLWFQRLQERNCFMLEVSSVEFVRCKAHGKELFDTSQTMQRRKLRGLESVAVLDGILLNKSLTGLSVLVDPAFSSCRLLSKHHMESVEEMVSALFNLALSDEKMNDERLHLDQVNAFRTLQLCVSKSNSPVIRNLNEDVRACKEYKSMMDVVQRSVQTNSTKEESSNLSGDHFTDGVVWLHAMLRESMFLPILPLNQEKDWFKIRTWFNISNTFCVYGVYHLQRPPELRLAKRYDQEFDKVFSLSSLRTRMF